MLILTPKGIYAAFETHSYSNLEYDNDRELGPGEIVVFDADSCKTLVNPNKNMKMCTFLWVYYGYPSATYEGVNVEEMRYRCGANMAKRDSDSEKYEQMVEGIHPDHLCTYCWNGKE